MLIAVLALTSVGATGTVVDDIAGAVGTGFEDRLVTAVPLPMAIGFTPDGRLLVAAKAGTLHVYKNGALLAAPALDIRAKVCANSERGLLGLAVDPNFAVNRSIFLYYTFNKYGSCTSTTANRAVNRVSSFTLSDTNVVD